MGGANLAAGVTAGFPVGASGSRTAVNDQIGGRTQLVGVFAAVVVALVLLFLTAPVGELPNACLGAVIVAAAIGLIEPADWRNLARAGRSQVVIAAVTFVGVVTIGVLQALIIAVAMSILDTVSRRAQPHDAVLGWVDRLDRYADVSLHPSAQGHRRCRRLPHRRRDLLRRRVLLQGPRPRGCRRVHDPHALPRAGCRRDQRDRRVRRRGSAKLSWSPCAPRTSPSSWPASRTHSASSSTRWV